MVGGGTGGAGPASACAAAAISRTQSPSRDATSGAIGRLLQRTASLPTTKKNKRISAVAALKKRLSVSSADDEGRLLESPPRAAMALAAPHQWPRRTPADAGDLTQPQPQQICAKPTAAEIEMPSATPQPQLQRRASFRDRLHLKGWQKARPPAESTPRTVYVPKHAAADFSRMPVSPLGASRPRQPTPMPTLTEDGTPAGPPLNGQARPPHSDEAARSRPQRDEESSANRHYRSHSGPELNSYPVIDNPMHASTAAVHIPINSQPTAWSTQPPAAPPSHPPSDYEIFLARAEAEEREQYLRSVYQRSAAYAYSSSHVMPDPHRQFATPGTAGGAGSSAAADRVHRRSNSGNRHVLNGDNGERQRQQDAAAAARNRAAARASWTPSYGTGGSQNEKAPEGKKLAVPARQAKTQPVQPRQLPLKQQTQTQRVSVDGGDEGVRRSREYKPPATPPASGGLRRQGSFKKRFVEYIRPPKTVWPVQTVVE